MKKVIALSMAIAAASSANAALQLGNVSNNEAGELFITMWNKDNQTSFVQDLNLFVSDLNYNTGVIADGTTITLSQQAIDALGAGDISWTVAGANSDKTTNEFDRDLFPANQWRDNDSMLFTANETPFKSPTTTTVENKLFAAWGAVEAKVNASTNTITDVYQLDGNTYFGAPDWGLGMGLISADFGFAYANGTNDGTMDLFGFQYRDDKYDDGTGLGDEQYHLKQYGSFTLSGNELTFNTVSAVPVPAAAWLFGSALVGLAGIGRKRKAH
mgnify:CR=1 FL=1